MNRPIRFAWLAALLAAAPLSAPLAAQEDAPRRGKIDDVEREARSGNDDDDGDGGFWLVDLTVDVIGALFRTPKGPGQGYLPYPYAAPRASESFVLSDVQAGRRYGVIGVGRFGDASSTLSGTSFTLDGAVDVLRYNVEYTRYREPLATEVDHLSTFRLGFGFLPRIGTRGFLHVGTALRAVCLDDGSCGGGGDLELGTQLFPARPFGLAASVRVGGVNWPSGTASFVTETNTYASLFVGRVEVRGGWHWLKFSGATAFGGPTLGARVWL